MCRFRVATSWRRANKCRKRRPCWSVTRLASIIFRRLAFSYWTIKPWFLTEGKLPAVLIIPSSWDSQLDGDLHHQHRAASVIWMKEWSLRNGRTLIIEDQKADFGTLGFGRQMEESRRYLDLSTLWRKSFGWSANLQGDMRIKAWFIAWRFLILSPPSFFGAQISFQARRQRDLAWVSLLSPIH
jgi:hypothetical protein